MKTFSDLGLNEELCSKLKQNGIETPFEIQENTIGFILEGKDVCGKAPTGSGKTLAFILPLIQNVSKAKPKKPVALILCPTRELASQIHKEIRYFIKGTNTFAESYYGGVSYGYQIKSLQKGVEIVIGCPGRILDLVNSNKMNLADVSYVVIDEADRMADMGFLPDVRKILDMVQSDRQTLLFSATLDNDVNHLIKNYQNNPEFVEVLNDLGENSKVNHEFIAATKEDKLTITLELVKRHQSSMVFCKTRNGTEKLSDRLLQSGIKAVAIHGNRTQAQRSRAVADFSTGKASVIVATDVASRGLHIDNVDCVIHFDMPDDHKDYLHRSGRTGRAGKSGRVFSLITTDAVRTAKRIQKELELSLADDSMLKTPDSGLQSRRYSNRGNVRRTSAYSKAYSKGYSSAGKQSADYSSTNARGDRGNAILTDERAGSSSSGKRVSRSPFFDSATKYSKSRKPKSFSGSRSSSSRGGSFKSKSNYR